jgi:hypothetical protein
MHREFEYLPLMKFDTPFTEGRKFRYLFLVPDSEALAEDREASHSHEEMLGEQSSNLSKLDWNIQHSHNVFSPHAFVAWMANCAGYQASMYTSTWNGRPEAPYFHENTILFSMFHQFADMVTDGKTWYFFKMASRSPVRILLWLTSVADQATILLTSGVSGPMNITCVLKGQNSAIPTANYDEARTLIADTIDKLGKIINGTDSAPSCLLV